MSEIKIKQEFFPDRCEICHQMDQFDPASMNCQRCQDIRIFPTDRQSSKEKGSFHKKRAFKMFGMSAGSFLGAIMVQVLSHFMRDSLMDLYVDKHFTGLERFFITGMIYGSVLGICILLGYCVGRVSAQKMLEQTGRLH